MASPGNPNQQPGQGAAPGGGGAFDINKLFKPSSGPPLNLIQPQGVSPSAPPPAPSTSVNLTTSPSFPLPSSSPPYITPSSSYPPPSGPFHHPFHPHYLPPYPTPPPQPHHPNHYFPNIQHQNRPPSPISTYPSPPPLSPVNSGGAVIMDILTSQNHNQHQLPQQLPSFSTTLNGPSSATSSALPSAPPVSLASPTLQSSPTPIRMPSTKLPRGRHLIGNNVNYDIDVRLQGEVQPQLEVTPITKYVSDPGLALGRQIAVNRNYICYGLKPGAIRILNINTALRFLLRGHNQKVSDMSFFAEDVHLLASACVEGRLFVRKVTEGPGEEDNKPQIFERIIVALQVNSEKKPAHPRVCWHPHKQEILILALGNHILKIDINRVGKGEGFSAEQPLKISIDKLIDGVHLVGKHDGEVTELSMCQWMTTRLASASTDGTVKVWEDRKAVPLAILRPHDGNPVNSVAFLTGPDRPDHIVLITGGPRNQELKIWASESEEGWLLPSDGESWQCFQTLTLKSSSESSVEDAFFNQAVALPRAGVFLLANAKKNAIYAVHIEYGPYPAATRMDYIAEFTVTMPILSLTGTSDSLPNGERVVQVYCIQTQAIQQYALDLSQCLPPPLENTELDRTESNVSCALDAPYSDSSVPESPIGSTSVQMPSGSMSSTPPVILSNSDSASLASRPEGLNYSEAVSLPDVASSGLQGKGSSVPLDSNDDNVNAVSPLLPMGPGLSRKFSGLQISTDSPEPIAQFSDQGVLDFSVDERVESEKENLIDAPSTVDTSRKAEKKIAHGDIRTASEPTVMFKHPTHLVTPTEFLSRAVSSSENSQINHGMNVADTKVQDVVINNEEQNVEVEVKVVGEAGINEQNDFDLPTESNLMVAERKEKSFYSQASDLTIQMARDTCVEGYGVGGNEEGNEGSATILLDRPSNTAEDKDQDMPKVVYSKVGEQDVPTAIPQLSFPAAKKKQKGKNSLVASVSSPSQSPFNSTDSSAEPGCSAGASLSDAASPQLSALHDVVDQLFSMQKEIQKQMSAMISVPAKEGKRLETSLGRNMERTIKANTDALWARFQEENTKRDKLERDRMQQLTNAITNCMNKDFPTALEKTLKKEIATIGPAVARAITPTLEKTISSAITESFQKGVGEKAVNLLEKSVSLKLEATVARQIQSQFQTSGKQALQDVLRSSLEGSVIPAFEMSCKAMFDQIDAAFQRGLTTHLTSAQQQLDSMHSPLAITLRDAINSASSITQTLSGELADAQRKILAIAVAGANSNLGNSLAGLSNGPLSSLHETAEAPIDPTKELSRLIAEHKYEEAFTAALHISDVSIVSWLCSQVDLQGILCMSPLPLSQGVLLALLQQLACDMRKETLEKMEWMRDVATAINPTDPMIAVHVKPIFDQVLQILEHHRSLPTTTKAEHGGIRTLLFIINQVLKSC